MEFGAIAKVLNDSVVGRNGRQDLGRVCLIEVITVAEIASTQAC